METETKETPVKGTLIYQPQGAAGEYAKWAINLYHGCSNGCTYCYNRRGVLSHVFGDKPELAELIVKARDKNLNRYMKKIIWLHTMLFHKKLFEIRLLFLP